MKTFASMDLFGPLKTALAEQNYEQPTPIQAQTIQPAIDGQDILGCAQTGTGKTAAFALPILDYLGNEQRQAVAHRPIALVLAPTRELAIQISDSFRVYGKHMQFRQALVYGGISQTSQVKALRRGADVLVATPGRLMDLMDQGHINLQDIEIFVLDEADRMLDMGFLPALRKIIAKLPNERQSMFFSATMPPKIRDLSAQLLFNPVSVDVSPKSTTVELIEQTVVMVERDNKINLLRRVLDGDSVDRAIVFTRTKHGANKVAAKLDRMGISATAIHGNKSQNARQKALDAFRNDKVTVLVATDVAARGIDIDGVTHVVNFDMPVEAESYVHRIGRTGRAGADGIAISFCTSDERGELRAIENLIGQRLQVDKNMSDPNAMAPSKQRADGARKSTRRHQTGNRPAGRGSRKRQTTSQANKSRRRPGKARRRPASAR